MKVWNSRVVEIDDSVEVGRIVQLKPFPVVSTSSGGLELREIQLPGKNRCDATALVNGFQLQLGESLTFSPNSK